jgi:hypothetical protein
MTRIHMLSGSKEYQSIDVLPKLAEYLAGSGIAQSSISGGEEKGTTLPGLLQNIGDIDVLLVFCKRMELEDEQLTVAWVRRDPEEAHSFHKHDIPFGSNAAISVWCRTGHPPIRPPVASTKTLS